MWTVLGVVTLVLVGVVVAGYVIHRWPSKSLEVVEKVADKVNEKLDEKK